MAKKPTKPRMIAFWQEELDRLFKGVFTAERIRRTSTEDDPRNISFTPLAAVASDMAEVREKLLRKVYVNGDKCEVIHVINGIIDNYLWEVHGRYLTVVNGIPAYRAKF